jgi:hypothetical protein
MTDEFREDIHAMFGDAADEAIEVLATYGNDGEPDTVGVRRAILALFEGDMGPLRHNARRANQDFRDVLYWAENPPDAEEPKSYKELRERLRLPPDDQHPS